MNGTATQTGEPMPIFERGTIVRVPFPYTNRPVQQRRPAIVVSSARFGAETHLLWVVMVTSAENRAWPGDVSLITTYAEFGLPAPSIIHTAKIATIESSHADSIGKVSDEVLRKVDDHLRRNMSI